MRLVCAVLRETKTSRWKLQVSPGGRLPDDSPIDFQSMEKQLLRIFQLELQTQCEFILLGGRQVNGCLKMRQPTQVIWFALQGMLVSAANASKLLWGSRSEEAVEARRQLRESVGVTDDSSLSSRHIRNDFEHFDERLEDWFNSSRDHIYIGRVIGDPDGFIVNGGTPDDKFGHFDPSTTIISFWGRSVALQEIVVEAERVLAALEEIGKKPRA